MRSSICSFGFALIIAVGCIQGWICKSLRFECSDARSESDCLYLGDFCDGSTHCRDGSDELTTVPAVGSGYGACYGRDSAYNGMEPCRIRDKYFCDGETICVEGTDECLCGEKTKDHLDNICFRCLKSSTFIPIAKVCDGRFDCPDLTDECLCRSPEHHATCERLGWEGQDPYLQCGESNISKRIDVNARQICDMNYVTSDCKVVDNEKHCMRADYKGALGPKSCYLGAKRLENTYQCLYYTHSVSYSTCLRDKLHCKVFLDNHKFLEIYYNSSNRWITCTADFENQGFCQIRYQCTNASYQEVLANKDCKIQDIECPRSRNCKVKCTCNYFYCGGDQGGKYINEQSVCDGHKDCVSGIDECQPGCIDSAFSDEKSLITNKAVLAVVWMISIIAIIGCASVVASTFHDVVKSVKRAGNSSHSNISKSLILSLSISDLLVGIYTISVCIKAIQVEGSYCFVDIEWRSSTTCSVLGALLVIGSEQSVLTMVLITIYRLHAVMRPLSRPTFKRAILAIVMSWSISIVIGLIPLIPSFEDYFLSDVTFNDTAIFKTKVNRNDKELLIKWLGFLNNGSIQESVDSTEWDTLRRLISEINEYSPIVSIHEFGYYSSHTVCLPTFFPDRKNDGSWVYSLVLLLFNFMAFLFMLVCYIALYRIANDMRILESSTAREKRDKQSVAMQRKLTRILASDFLCWMPVCIMGFLQLAGVDIPKDAYLPTGLLILPINSALNPFLYSDYVDLILSRAKTCMTRTTYSLRGIKDRGSVSASTQTADQTLELKVIDVN